MNNTRRLSYEHELDYYEIDELKRKNRLYDCSNYIYLHESENLLIIDLDLITYDWSDNT